HHGNLGDRKSGGNGSPISHAWTAIPGARSKQRAGTVCQLERCRQRAASRNSAHRGALRRLPRQVDVSLPHPRSRRSRDDGRSRNQTLRTGGDVKVERSACGAMVVAVALAMTACSQPPADSATTDSAVPLIQASNTVVPVASTPEALAAQVARGRIIVMSHACADCHGGGSNPSADGYLAGTRSPIQEFKIGPCAIDPNAKPCFTTRPRNLTP